MARVSALFKAVIDLGGDAVDNLRSLGYLTEESAQNPTAVKTAQTKYRKALTESPAMRRREAERLGVSQFEDADLGPEKIMQPEGLLGSTLIPVFGDKTVTGRTITAQRGRLLDTPVESHGGARFAQQQQGTGRGYMSMETAAKSKQKNVDFAAERTGSDDIVGVFTGGADPSYQFAAPMADLMFKQTMDAGVPKAALREFDKTLRQVRPDWVGMESPDALAQLLGTGDYPMEGAGALRIAFTEEMSKARWRDQGFGVPQDAIEVITEPGLLGAARGDSGLAMIDMQPGAETIKAPGLHQSYNTIIQGDYAGGLGRSVPAPIMFPDTFAFMQREGRSPSSQLGSLMMDPKLYQKADENWLTGILDYLAKNPTALSAAGAAGLLGAAAPEEAEAGTSGLVANILRAFGDDVDGATQELVRMVGFPDPVARRIATGELPMDSASVEARRMAQGYGDELYHGSTHDIIEFDGQGSPSNDWGQGTYLTDSVFDASTNYAGEGPDLTNRILSTQEELDDEIRSRVRYSEDLNETLLDIQDEYQLNQHDMAKVRAWADESGLISYRGGKFMPDHPDFMLNDQSENLLASALTSVIARKQVKGSNEGVIYPVRVKQEGLLNVTDEVELPNYNAQAADELGYDYDKYVNEEYDEDVLYEIEERGYDLQAEDYDSPNAAMFGVANDLGADMQNVESIYEGDTWNDVRNKLGEASVESDEGDYIGAGGILADVMGQTGATGVVDAYAPSRFPAMGAGRHTVIFPGNQNLIRSVNAAYDPQYTGPNIMGATSGLGTAGIIGAIEAGQRADNAMAVSPQSETLQQGLIQAAVQAHNERVAEQKRELGVDYDPRYDYGMILPYKKDIVTGETSLAFPEIARGIIGALIDLGNTPRTGVYNPNAILDVAL